MKRSTESWRSKPSQHYCDCFYLVDSLPRVCNSIESFLSVFSRWFAQTLMILREPEKKPELKNENWDPYVISSTRFIVLSLSFFDSASCFCHSFGIQPSFPSTSVALSLWPFPPHLSSVCSFLPKFKKKSVKSKKTAEPKKKERTEKLPFPPAPTPRKEDVEMETGEYFLKEEEKNAKLQDKKVRGVFYGVTPCMLAFSSYLDVIHKQTMTWLDRIPSLPTSWQALSTENAKKKSAERDKSFIAPNRYDLQSNRGTDIGEAWMSRSIDWQTKMTSHSLRFHLSSHPDMNPRRLRMTTARSRPKLRFSSSRQSFKQM